MYLCTNVAADYFLLWFSSRNEIIIPMIKAPTVNPCAAIRALIIICDIFRSPLRKL